MLAVEGIPLDDKKTYDLLSLGDTIGCFQLDGAGMRGLLKQIKPENIYDIAVVLALYRPGPMDSGGMKQYVERRREAKK